jgi:hypothetical protein
MGLVRLFVPDGKTYMFNREVFNPICREFGGCTVIEAKGGWLNPRATIVREPILIVEVYPDRQRNTNSDRAWFEDQARRICNLWEQDCVLLDFYGDVKFIGRRQE